MAKKKKTKREKQLERILECALHRIRREQPQGPDMGACWLFAQGEMLLGKKDWDSFKWRYDGS